VDERIKKIYCIYTMKYYSIFTNIIYMDEPAGHYAKLKKKLGTER
jgi:hypothetical protein